MNIAINHGEQATVVQITGSVDSLTADALMQAMSNEVGAYRVCLVADFSGVEYTSSAGLRALLTTLKDARGNGGDLRLAAVRPTVRKVLELSGFTSILKIFDDVPTAVASFGAAGDEAGAKA
jgi:anti-anti-sigma factor